MGYSVSLTLNARNKAGAATGGYTIALTAPPAAQPSLFLPRANPALKMKTLENDFGSPRSPRQMLSLLLQRPKSQRTSEAPFTHHARSSGEAQGSTRVTINGSRNEYDPYPPPTHTQPFELDGYLPSTDPISRFVFRNTRKLRSVRLAHFLLSRDHVFHCHAALSGIRFLDIRLALKGTLGNQLLYAYHESQTKKSNSLPFSTRYTTSSKSIPPKRSHVDQQENTWLDSKIPSSPTSTKTNPLVPLHWYSLVRRVRGKIVLISRLAALIPNQAASTLRFGPTLLRPLLLHFAR